MFGELLSRLRRREPPQSRDFRPGDAVRVQIGKAGLTLETQQPHELKYAMWLLRGRRYAQADIDDLLFQRLIRPGDRVLDAGANIGLTALLALKHGASHVCAVEPLPDLAARIRAIGNKRIECVEAALSNFTGTITMNVSIAHNQGSSYKDEMVETFPHIFSGKRCNVPGTTIDALCAKRKPFDVWKLDLEGAEGDALAGGHDALTRTPPRAVIAELYGKELQAECRRRLDGTYPWPYRAVIDPRTYTLTFLPFHSEAAAPQWEHTSPMFVFTREELKQP